MAFIYTLSDPITNQVRYIGKTCQPLEKRLNEHIYESKRSRRKSTNWVKSLINKKLLPIIEPLEECDCESACEIESYWIYQFTTWGFNLLNHSFGGEGGYRRETDKQKEDRKNRFRGDKNPFYGRKHSQESKDKISKSGKGRTMPNSHIESCKKRMLGFKPTEDQINKMISVTAKPIVQMNLEGEAIKTWSTINGCAREGGFLAPQIIKCCKNKGKTHRGFKWKYA